MVGKRGYPYFKGATQEPRTCKRNPHRIPILILRPLYVLRLWLGAEGSADHLVGKADSQAISVLLLIPSP